MERDGSWLPGPIPLRVTWSLLFKSAADRLQIAKGRAPIYCSSERYSSRPTPTFAFMTRVGRGHHGHAVKNESCQVRPSHSCRANSGTHSRCSDMFTRKFLSQPGPTLRRHLPTLARFMGGSISGPPAFAPSPTQLFQQLSPRSSIHCLCGPRLSVRASNLFLVCYHVYHP